MIFLKNIFFPFFIIKFFVNYKYNIIYRINKLKNKLYMIKNYNIIIDSINM